MRPTGLWASPTRKRETLKVDLLPAHALPLLVERASSAQRCEEHKRCVRRGVAAGYPSTANTARARTTSRWPTRSEQSANASLPPRRSTSVRASTHSPTWTGPR